jgi:hypothetical protein
MGIEPTPSAWKAEVLPLNYTRLNHSTLREYFTGPRRAYRTPVLLREGLYPHLLSKIWLLTFKTYGANPRLLHLLHSKIMVGDTYLYYDPPSAYRG